jgi:hypothetical protein
MPWFSVGHMLSYCPMNTPSTRHSRRSRERCGQAVCSPSTSATLPTARPGTTHRPVRVHDDWAIISQFSLPAPDRFVRQITAFVRSQDGSWRRDDETHHNVLIATARVPALLAAEGVQVGLASAFGTEQLPTGLRGLIGRRTA